MAALALCSSSSAQLQQ